MGHIRQFAPDDIPAIVALRRRTFEQSERPTADDLSGYLERIFFRNPWCNEGIPSLVYRNGAGEIAGFMGVVARPATFQNRPILQSLHWTQPLRPARFYAGRLAQRLRARALAWGLRPVSWAVDGLTARWPPARGLHEAPLTAALMAAHLPDLLGQVALQPQYDERSLRWLLDQLTATKTRGELRGVAVRSADGSLVGWYLYYANAGGVGQVVQVVARQGQDGDVLQCLFHDAWEEGLVALQGRLEPWLLPALGARGALLARDGPWVLVQSQCPELAAAIHRGDACLSRLDGEWWMSF